MFKRINNYTAIVLKLKQSLQYYPQVISVIEDDFIGDSIIVILDSKRFDITKIKIPSVYHGYDVSVLDIYSYVNGLQSFIDDKVLNDPLLWEPNVSLEIIERPLNNLKKIIREYENDLEQRRC